MGINGLGIGHPSFPGRPALPACPCPQCCTRSCDRTIRHPSGRNRHTCTKGATPLRLRASASARSSSAARPNTLGPLRSEEHTSELQSRENLVCRLLLEKKKKTQ